MRIGLEALDKAHKTESIAREKLAILHKSQKSKNFRGF
jgi:hypothetical protein